MWLPRYQSFWAGVNRLLCSSLPQMLALQGSARLDYRLGLQDGHFAVRFPCLEMLLYRDLCIFVGRVIA